MPENQAYIKGTIYRIKLEELQPDPNQPRKYIDKDALEELSKSIKQHGVLVPILFRVDENGQKIIVAGERRYQSSKEIGLNEIPALFVDGKHAEIALVENLLRQNLTPMEEAEALQQMKDQFAYSDMALSKVISKGRSTISEILSLNKLPESIRIECRRSFQIPRDKLVEIAKLEKTNDMTAMYEKVKKDNLTKFEIKKLKKELAEGLTIKNEDSDKLSADKSHIEAFVDRFIKILRKHDGKFSSRDKKKLTDLVKEIENTL